MSDYYTIQWQHDHVSMIDQRKLPLKEIYINCFTYQEVARAISDMVIRGAPAIGVAAAMGVALGVSQWEALNPEQCEKDFHMLLAELMNARPTAVNLRWALRRMKQVFDQDQKMSLPKLKEKITEEALVIFEEDIRINKKMAEQGQGVIQSNMSVLTYCNTGTLATAGYGTALGVIRLAHELGKKILVYVCETRPYLQGLRLTSWELWKLGISQTLITDNMAAYLMQQKKIDAVFVGADRIAANGDTANKIGTYMVALSAYHHQIPFYVVAPTSTIDLECPIGKEIPIEERSKQEVTTIQQMQMGLDTVPVYNPAFDVTPHHLIRGIITEKGIFPPSQIKGNLSALD